MKTTMIALKNFTYNTRRLKAGDEFQVDGTMGRALSAVGRAELKPNSIIEAVSQPKSEFKIPPPPVVTPQPAANAPETVEDDDADDMKELRAEYLKVVGKRPFPGWDEAELRRRMAEHLS